MNALVLGNGSAGRRQADILSGMGLEVSAWDVDPKRCTGYHAGKAEPDWRWPNIVAICTPPAVHYENAKQAVEAGVPMSIEKPLGTGWEPETAWPELLSEAEDRGLVVRVHYQMREHKDVLAFKNEIAHTKVHSVRFRYGNDLRKWRHPVDYKQRHVWNNHGAGGGILLEASHELDLARWLIGEPERPAARFWRHVYTDMPAEDTAWALWDCGQTTVAVMVDCTTGQYVRYAEATTGVGELRRDMERSNQPQAHFRCVARFLWAVRNGDMKNGGVTGWEALKTLRLVRACQESAETGKEIDL